MTSTSTPAETFNLDGELVAMGLAWRLACRRQYRAARRTWGPIGSRERVEAMLARSWRPASH